MLTGKQQKFKEIFDHQQHQKLEQLCEKYEEEISFTQKASSLYIAQPQLHFQNHEQSVSYDNSKQKVQNEQNQICNEQNNTTSQMQKDSEQKSISKQVRIKQCSPIMKNSTNKNEFQTGSLKIFNKNSNNYATQSQNLYGVQFRIVNTFKQLINRLESRRFQKINAQQINLINDLSHIYNEKHKENISDNSNRRITIGIGKHILSVYDKINIIEPTSKINILQSVISIFVNILLLYLYTFKIFFGLLDNPFTKSVQIIGILVNLQDILLKIFVGYYDKGQIVLDKKMILNKYLKGSLCFDFIQFVCIMISTIFVFINAIHYEGLIFYLNLFYFLKIKRINASFNKIDKILYIIAKANYLYQLLKLVFKLLVICHFVAIIWHLLGQIEIKYLQADNTWLHELDLVNASWIQRYIEAFYWSSTTIVILSGPKGSNPIEVIFQIIVMFATMGTFAYTINCIGMILDEQSKKQHEYKKDLETINKYMRRNNLKSELKQKVSNFLEYLYQEKGDIQLNKNSAEVLNKLPQTLKDDIHLEINSKIIEKFKCIQSNFSEKSLKEILHIIEEEYFLPNEIVHKNNNQSDIYVYWISRGSGKNKICYAIIYIYSVVYIEQEKKNGEMVILNSIEKDNTFGETQFFTGITNELQVRCKDFTTIFKIERNLFLKILQQHNEDYQKFMMIKDQFIYQNRTQFINLQCQICKSSEHKESNCEQVFYKQDKNITLQRFLHRNIQERQCPYQRKKLKIKFFSQIEKLKEISYKIDSDHIFSQFCQFIDVCNLVLSTNDQCSDLMNNIEIQSSDQHLSEEDIQSKANQESQYKHTSKIIMEESGDDVSEKQKFPQTKKLFQQDNNMLKSQSSRKNSNPFNSANSISSFKNPETSSVIYESGVSLGTQGYSRNDIRSKKRQKRVILKQHSSYLVRMNSQKSFNIKNFEQQQSTCTQTMGQSVTNYEKKQIFEDVLHFVENIKKRRSFSPANEKQIDCLLALYDQLIYKFNKLVQFDLDSEENEIINQQIKKYTFEQFIDFVKDIQVEIKCQQAEFLFFYDFECQRNFIKYFPKQNMKNIMQLYSQRQKKGNKLVLTKCFKMKTLNTGRTPKQK